MADSSVLNHLIASEAPVAVPTRNRGTLEGYVLVEYDNMGYLFRNPEGRLEFYDRQLIAGPLDVPQTYRATNHQRDQGNNAGEFPYNKETGSMVYNKKRYVWMGSSRKLMDAFFSPRYGIGKRVPLTILRKPFGDDDPNKTKSRLICAIRELRGYFKHNDIPLAIHSIPREGYILEKINGENP